VGSDQAGGDPAPVRAEILRRGMFPPRQYIGVGENDAEEIKIPTADRLGWLGMMQTIGVCGKREGLETP